MTSTNRKWLKLAVATIGAGALTLGGAVLPAAAADSADEPVAATTLTSAASKYDLAAARSGKTVTTIQEAEAAEQLVVTDDGFIKYIDPARNSAAYKSTSVASAEGKPIPGDAVSGSRPDAPVTVYLDFDGGSLTGTRWNQEAGTETINYAPGTGVDEEEVWARVAEDYAPFNVNVTTTNPGPDKLNKTSPDDNEYGAHVIITDSDSSIVTSQTVGGIAWVGGTGSEFLSGAWVFTQSNNPGSKAIAETASHESGHNFGLGHDGIDADNGEYYTPTEGLWAPIMGFSDYTPLSHWSIGDYAGATNTEDDLAIITDRASSTHIFIGVETQAGDPYTGDSVCVIKGESTSDPQPGDVWQIPNPDNTCDGNGEELVLIFDWVDRADYAADEAGNTAAEALALDNATGSFEQAAVIGSTDDVDVFNFVTAGGTVSATVEVADLGPNLAASLTLVDADGNAVTSASAEPVAESADVASGLGATIEADVEAGSYYLSVTGVGYGDPSTATPENANGFSKYASLGNYTLSGKADPLKYDAITITSPKDGAEVEGGTEVQVTGTATPEATVTLTVGGAVVDTVTADAEGKWAGKVTANQYGETEIVAAQSIGSIAVPGNAKVRVVAPGQPLAAPVITVPTDGATVDNVNPTIAGTGVAGATVTITIDELLDEYSGESFATLETVVDANGSWWVDVPNAMKDGGKYMVVASQALDGVVSDDSNVVNFTVAVPTGGGDGNGDGDLATTGSDFNAAPLAAMAALLLVIGGGFAVYARRQYLSADS